MTFRRRVRLDPGQVRDWRGQGMSGRGLALAGGGGGIGLIVLVLFVLLGGDLGGVSPDLGSVVSDTGATSGSLADCQSGEDANERLDCRIVGFANSAQAFWAENAVAEGIRYEEAPTTLFDGGVSTACGFATSEVGPFYCPFDGSVYLDLTFFQQMLRMLGAQGGPMAEGYVIAHEYGHHVQSLRGVLGGSRDTGAGSRAVATELQADCYAGAWAAEAADTGFLEPPSREEVAIALDAAAAVGDDRIQRRTTGDVDPESWTHGSSQQRQDWFLVGYRTGEPTDCRP